MNHSLFLALAITATATLVGCSSSHTSPDEGMPTATTNHLCDGSAGLRIRYFLHDPPARFSFGYMVATENRNPSFAVDGSCNYWMSPGWNAEPANTDTSALGWRSGRVDKDLEHALNQLPLGHLEELADCEADTLRDASLMAISDASSKVGCFRSGPMHQAAFEIVTARVESLWANAEPLTNGVWVSAVPFNDGDTSAAYPWPSSVPLSEFMLPEASWYEAGVARLIADESEVANLRGLRARYVDERRAAPGHFFDGQKMSDGTTAAVIYTRDQLPYENARGLWPFGMTNE